MTSHSTESKIDFTVYTKENAPEGSLNTLNAAEEKFGFIPNVFRQMAEAPAALQGDVQLIGLLEQTSLTPTEQRIVLGSAAFQYNSNYCMASNSAISQMMRVPADVIEGLRKGESLSDPKLEALRRFAQEIVREHGGVSEETTRRFFEAGYSKAQLFEVILGITLETMNSFTDRVVAPALDEQFKDCAWSRPE